MKLKLYAFWLLLTTSLLAQIPNAGFENWTNGEPLDWVTNNAPPTTIGVTQSNDARSGSSSVRLEVVSLNGFPIPTQMVSGTPEAFGFPCFTRSENLVGWYKFFPQQADLFTIQVTLFSNQTVIGTGVFQPSTGTPDWTQFSAPITYLTGENPDSCIIVIALSNTGGIDGAVALIDDLGLSEVTGIELTDDNRFPSGFALEQNYPNPFNPVTAVPFSIAEASKVSLIVYNLLGKKVAVLVNQNLAAGSYTARWDAANLPSGIYFYRLTAGSFSAGRRFVHTRRMILMQ